MASNFQADGINPCAVVVIAIQSVAASARWVRAGGQKRYKTGA
jgi:hypothetical protein